MTIESKKIVSGEVGADSYCVNEKKVLKQMNTKLNDLRSKIPILDKLCNDNGIEQINTLEDAVALKIAHKTYKTYPESLLNNKNFTAMNKWLERIFAVELSQIDVSKAQSITEWLTILKKHNIDVIHSSGTTGKPSFFIKDKEGLDIFWNQIGYLASSPYTKHDKPVPFFCVGFTEGFNIFVKIMTVIAKRQAKDQPIVFMIEGLLNPDSIRMETVMKRKIASSQASPEEIQQFQKIVEQKKIVMGQAMQEFAKKLLACKGKEIALMVVPSLLYTMTQQFAKMGLKDLFKSSSAIWTGGGLKGAVIPDNWLDEVVEVFGVPKNRIANFYAMTESNLAMGQCSKSAVYEGNFNGHFPSYVIPFLTDDTGEHLIEPKGIVTGRLGLIDPTSGISWGVVITGDKVTINFDGCPTCGYKGPTMVDIGRLSNSDDDKLSCAPTLQQYVEG